MAAEWILDLRRRELRSGGVAVPLGGRAFEIVEALVRAEGELVTKDALMAGVWRGTIVEDNTLQVHISAIRKALGADRTLLRTVAGRGYRLLGSWRIESQEPVPDKPAVAAVEPAPAALSPSNFPAATVELFGRSAAVQQVRDALSAYRAVTLTGPGGIGKTALALEVACDLLPSFHDKGWLVELAPLPDPGLVPSAVAAALGLKLGGEDVTAEVVARALGDDKLILVLDNCEHVIDGAAVLAETVVRLCPHTTVLATSREALRIDGEFVYRVPPLDVPSALSAAPDDLLAHSAVQLFVARTRAHNSEFAADRQTLSAIVAICRHLDGIPLAIEFAAARAATLGVSPVAAGVADRFALLTSGRRTALPRQQTLRATFDWSYDLLSEAERRLLRRLAVFPSAITFEAANAVASLGDASATAEAVAGLVSKSLLSRDEAALSGRWRLLETTRAYALEKLSRSGEREEAAGRHAEYFRDLVIPAAWSGSRLRLSIEDVDRLTREIDNVRVALDWSFSPKGNPATGVVLTAAFAPVWLHLSLADECRERAKRALATLTPEMNLAAPLERRLCVALVIALILTMGPVERARAVAAKARELAESVDDAEAQLRMLWAQWSVEFTAGECRAALSIAERFAEIAPRTGDAATALVGDRLIGNGLLLAGELKAAQTRLERVTEQYVAPMDQRHAVLFHYDQRALARAMLARVLWLGGAIDRANDEASASLEEARAGTGSRVSMCWALHYGVCPIALTIGGDVAAEQAVSTLIALCATLDSAIWRIIARCWEGRLLIRRGDFGGGSDLLRNSLAICDETGWRISYPEFMGSFAEGMAGLGQLGQAVAIVDRALVRVEVSGERWYQPELMRIKGEILLQQEDGGRVPTAAECFETGLHLAQEQGALYWQLRLALSLAKLLLKQDRPLEARQVLAPICGRFAEGLDIADLKSARAVLRTAASS